MTTIASPPRQAVWYLDGFLEEGGEIRHVPLAPLPFQVGRRNELSLCLPFNSVSKLHAEFRPDANGVCLADLNSTNGTFVNGQRIFEPRSLKRGDIVQFAQAEFRISCAAAAEGGATVERDAGEIISLLCKFDELFDPGKVRPYLQPIVRLNDGGTIGYEVLARSCVEGLETPYQMLGMAERMGLEGQLSRLFRHEGLEQARHLPAETTLFVNTHPVELAQPGLIESLRELRHAHGQRRIVLEIHEAAVTAAGEMRPLRAMLTDLDIGLAYDDFGAGQARLTDLVEVPPDYLKFDMGLVRGIDQAPPQRQRMLQTLVQMACNLGIEPLAEGIESAAEAEVCRQLGFTFAQGYHFGRPSPIAKFLALLGLGPESATLD